MVKRSSAASPAVVATPTSARAASFSACRAASTNAMSASAASASLRRREASPRFARMARLTAKRRRMAVPLPPRSSARARARTVRGALRGKPLSRFTVEVFGNRASGSSEGEIFLGDVVATSDAEGNGKFSLAVDASKLAAMPVSFTATLTSTRRRNLGVQQAHHTVGVKHVGASCTPADDVRWTKLPGPVSARRRLC